MNDQDEDEKNKVILERKQTINPTLKNKIKKYSSKRLNFVSKEVVIQKLKSLESATIKQNGYSNLKESAKSIKYMNSLRGFSLMNRTSIKKKESCCNQAKAYLKHIWNNFNKKQPDENPKKSLFQMDDLSYLIYPDSFFKKFWNFIVSILLIYTAVVLPYTICFLDDSATTVATIELVVDILFMIDIPVNFFSAYYSETGIIIDDLKMVASKYLRTWFFLDLIGSFPLQLIMNSDISDSGITLTIKQIATFRIYKLLRLLRMIKMIRVLKYGKMINYIFLKLKINLAIGKIIFIFFSIYLIVHIVSCLWVFLVKINDSQVNWISNIGLDNEDNFSIYITSLYWAFFTIFTVGFGDVHPTNNVEKIFCVVWMVFGAGFYSYTIGNLMTIIQNYDKKESVISNKMDQIDDFTAKIQLNPPLSAKIKAFFQHKFTENFIYDHDNIIDELSPDLTFKVIQNVFAPVLSMFDIFHHNPPINFINSLILKFKALYVDDKDYFIYKFGERAEEVYFMIFGKIAMVDEDNNECLYYGAGTYFGEVEVLFDEPRLFTIRTMKVCEMLFISRENYLNVLRQYHKIFEMEIYKSYKRRHFYLSRIIHFRNNKLKKLGKDVNEQNAAYIDIDDSMNMYGKGRKEEDQNLQKLYTRKEMRVVTKKFDQTSEFLLNINDRNNKKDREVQQILDKIDANNLNIDMKTLDQIKTEVSHFSKEYNKNFKKIKNNLSSINAHAPIVDK